MATGGSGTGGAPPISRILSIDFIGGTTMAVGGSGGGGGGGGASALPLVALPSLSPAEIAGFKRASHWNGAPGPAGSMSDLVLADGSPAGATVTWSSPLSATNRGVWRIGYIDSPGDVRMMNGYLDPHAADMPDRPATIVVSGLPTSFVAGGYDVYVYASGEVDGGTRTYAYTIGATTLTISQTGPSATTFVGYALAADGGSGNYVVFRKLNAAFFTLVATPGSGTSARAPVNGIQIVSPSGS